MKKICMAVGCLILIQTSAFSLQFSIGEDIDEATVEVIETVDDEFTSEIEPFGAGIYEPKRGVHEVKVVWKVKGQPDIDCNTPSRPINQEVALQDQFKLIKLIKSPQSGKYLCAKK